MQRRLHLLVQTSRLLAKQRLQQAAQRDLHQLAPFQQQPCTTSSLFAFAFGQGMRHLTAAAAGRQSTSLLPAAARQAMGEGTARMRGRWQEFVETHKHQVEEISERWQRFESRTIAVVNGVSLSSAGQAVVSALLPITLVAVLFPRRLRCAAYELPPSALQFPHGGRLSAHRPAPKGRLVLALEAIAEEIAIALRGMYLLALFAPAVLGAPFVFYLGLGRETWMELMRITLERAGPAFIKWGQWASTRPDLFPQDLCKSLESLQSNAPSHDGRYSIAKIEKAFDRPLGQLFSVFETDPIASGSIAQIHRARLAPDAAASSGCKPGMEVAVKVRHPGVSTLMARDFVLMQRAAATAGMLPALKELRLDESIRQFGGPLQEQLNLAVEASHLSRFRHNFRRWRNVSFPRPLYPLVQPDVLVETFETGSLITGLLNDAGLTTFVDSPLQGKQLCDKVAQTGLNAYLQMLLHDNFIHADLHPGNILVRTVHPSSWGGLAGWLRSRVPGMHRAQTQLVLLDTGMIAELSTNDQASIVDFFKALTKKDGEGLAHAMLKMSEQHTCPDPDSFVTDLKVMFEKLDPETITKHTSDVLRDMIERLRQHQVTLKSTVSTVVVTTLVLEGWSSKLNPDLHIMDTLREMLAAADWRERIGRTVDRIVSSKELYATWV